MNRVVISWGVAIVISLVGFRTADAKLVIFGDSLSDTGNFSALTGGQFPPSPLYPRGRFTNGLVWVDYLARDLRLSDPRPSLAGGCNYAFNGSRAAGVSPFGTPALGQQVAMFLSDNDGQADPEDIFVIWAGANDIFFGAAGQEPDFIVNGVTAIQSAMLMLYQSGARRFLVLNLPALGQTPYFADSPLIAGQLDLATAAFNQLLAATVQATSHQLPTSMIAQVDVFGTFQLLRALPQRFQLKDTTTACTIFDPSSGISLGFALREDVDPSRFVFWDGVHPTTRVHEIIGKSARQAARMRLSPIRR